MLKCKNNIAIIFAGGIGKRLNSQENSLPKQFLRINDKPIIIHTLEIFQQHEKIDKIYLAIHPEYCDYMQDLVEYYHITKVDGIVKGGNTGLDSIYNALKYAENKNSDDSIVLIHDGVRPNITKDVIDKNIEIATTKGSAITCTSCYETILLSKDGIIPEQVPYRKHTYAAQAPQTFRLGEIITAHEAIRKFNPNYTDIVDSCTMLKTLGKETYMVEGNRGNIKITTIEDLYILRAFIRFKEDKDAFGIEKE